MSIGQFFVMLNSLWAETDPARRRRSGISFVMEDTTIQNDPQNTFLAIREDTTGFFFSTANKGNVEGNGAVRAGILDDYYYIVRDPTWVNTGMSITPNGRAPCEVAKCELHGCGLDGPNLQDAYTSPPRRMPALGDAPPERPIYACPGLGDAGFCPNGAMGNLQRGPYSINPVGQVGKCLQVPQGVPVQNATPVQIGECHGFSNEKWEILHGRAQIKIKFAGTNFCIDATTARALFFPFPLSPSLPSRFLRPFRVAFSVPSKSPTLTSCTH
ncbi:hypothetical protein BDV98DRAFT_585447 [Pterulicium gracile]|uniref:Uncharacterized protein n=1 Tax=Pterulicium gracile TaxID=1884261 RepID=A0A5C3Q6I8_9AGAR|nr:hypothetical protein BDV98DRAFT_585447 [Pterula gracilis]